MPRKQAACAVCGLAFAAGEPVAWTVGRDRIHESCIDLARVAASGRATIGRWKAPAVRMFLERAGGRLCASCLAMALTLSLEQARELFLVIDGIAGLRVLPVPCASCSRSGSTLCAVPFSTTDRVAS